MIRAPKAVDCWTAFENHVRDYWARMGQAGSSRGVIAVTPVFTWDQTKFTGEIALGGAFVRGHEPMVTSEEVEALFKRSRRSGVMIGEPPTALVLGIQQLGVKQGEDGDFLLRTTWYRYYLLIRSIPAQTRSPTWFALRLENDSRIGQNSWLLNHPIHHIQLGLCDDLRLLSSRGRSLLSFVDAALRGFAEDAWSDMYPALHLELSEPEGRFAPFTRSPEGADVHLAATHADEVKKILRQGRAEKLDWSLELDQWRNDVSARSICAPEMFDVFAGEP